jgi:hypothetical protein
MCRTLHMLDIWFLIALSILAFMPSALSLKTDLQSNDTAQNIEMPATTNAENKTRRNQTVLIEGASFAASHAPGIEPSRSAAKSRKSTVPKAR